ncbi:hypothetical protein TELCIR_22223, partial [Teladorsagia circumcincta]
SKPRSLPTTRTTKLWPALERCICTDKKGAGGGGGGGGEGQLLLQIRALKPAPFDPTYQTVAGIGGDVFGADKKGEGGGKPAAPKIPANLGAKAGTFDPNYQTLNGTEGSEVFGANKKR